MRGGRWGFFYLARGSTKPQHSPKPDFREIHFMKFVKNFMKFVKNPPCKNHAKLCLHNTNHETPCNNHANNYLHNSV